MICAHRGAELDAPNSGCAGSGTPLDLTLNSPHVRHLAELPELQGRDGALARDRRVVRWSPRQQRDPSLGAYRPGR